MKKFILAAAVSAAALASPAAARDGQGYFGVEGGILFPRDQDADLTVVTDFDGDTITEDFDDAVGIDYKRGIDLDVIAGYDFGMFRLEGELGYKRAKFDSLEFSEEFEDAIVDLDDEEFDLSGRAKVVSGMINGLVDFGDENGVSFYAGGGFGRARVKFAGEKDGAWAYQLIAGLRTAVSDNIDLGLKYRYFRTGKLEFFDDTVALVDDGVGTAVFGDFDQRFRSHSLLASLIFNFGAPAVEPAPPPPPVVEPVAPPPPATQTCPDGSVILASDSCPLPPPPPPPPPPAPERG